MTILQDILAAFNWNVRVTENFRSTSPAGLYGIDPSGITGLVFGYLGGEFNGVTVANGTVTLTASNTNYIVAHRTTGAVTAATNTTNWDNSATYLRLYQVVTNTTSMTTITDKRQAFADTLSAGMSNPMTTSEDIIKGGASGAATRLAKGSDGQVLGVVAGAVAWTTLAGTGDVVGPASAVDDRIATFDSTTGKLIQDSGKTIADLRAPAIQSVTSSATVTPTFADDMVKITAQAAGLTLANPTGTAIPGLGMVIRIKDNGTARSITYGSQYRAIGITLPTTTVISKTTYIAMIYNSDDTKWDCVATGTEA
jgi:hypothetical protein